MDAVLWNLDIEQKCLERLVRFNFQLLSSNYHLIVFQGSVCVQRFNVEDACNTQCVVTSFQKRYFFTESIEQAKEELRYSGNDVTKSCLTYITGMCSLQSNLPYILAYKSRNFTPFFLNDFSIRLIRGS